MIVLNHNNKFINLSFGVILVVFLLSALTFVFAVFLGVETFRIIFIILAIVLVLFVMLLFTGFTIINRILKKDENSSLQQDMSPLRKR